MKKFILLLSVSLLFIGCTKNLELDIIESQCKDFRISNAQSTFEVEPNASNCPITDLTGNTINITFNTSGVNDCLNSLHRTVVFYDEQNNKITTISQDADSINITDPTFVIGSNLVSFKFSFNMASFAEYDRISYATINFYTQNEILNQSNKLAIVANLPCKQLPDPTIFDQTITVRNTSLTVRLWDNASEDGDIITIIINNEIVASNVLILNTPKTFTFNIDPTADNHISFFAVNEGTSSPNTVSGDLNDGFTSQSFGVDMNEGETISFDLIYQGF